MIAATNIVIIGGGIAGISCLDTLLAEHRFSDFHHTSITLISESRVIKKVVNHLRRGRNLESFNIVTGDVSKYYPAETAENFDFRFVVGNVVSIDCTEQIIHLVRFSDLKGDPQTEFSLKYDILCLANGSSPRQLDPDKVAHTEVHDRILTVRDTTSIQRLEKCLVNVKKVAILGNGGISLELVHKLTHCDISWVIRDEFVGHPFLDSGASKFLLEAHSKNDSGDQSSSNNFDTYGVADNITYKSTMGPALGPHWLDGMRLIGACRDTGKLEIFYKTEVGRVLLNSSGKHELKIILKDSRIIEADLIILALGVVPNKIRFISGGPDLSSIDGGILIDTEMRTSVREIYASGDVVSCERWPQDTLWFQMRLWTQARQMGQYCARCISAHVSKEDPSIFANFECFTHMTTFLGFKIVLLGRYNEQHLNRVDSHRLEVVARVNRGKDYIKLVLEADRVIGAILVGETNLDETIENLIYDQIDIRDIKHQLLDDTIDIEDYFD